MNYRMSCILMMILISTQTLLPAETVIHVAACPSESTPLLAAQPYTQRPSRIKAYLAFMLLLTSCAGVSQHMASVSKAHQLRLPPTSDSCLRVFHEQVQLTADVCDAVGCREGFNRVAVCKPSVTDVPKIHHQLRLICPGNGTLEMGEVAVGVCEGSTPPRCVSAEKVIRELNTTCNPQSLREELTLQPTTATPTLQPTPSPQPCHLASIQRLATLSFRCNNRGCPQGFARWNSCSMDESAVAAAQAQLKKVCLGDEEIHFLPHAEIMCTEDAAPCESIETIAQELNTTCNPPSPTSTLHAEEAIKGITRTNNPLSLRDRLKMLRKQLKKERTNH